VALSEEQIERYSRQIVLPEIGGRGQQVLVAGAGGLGSPAALYLAAAGVGTIGIVDGDAVELSNLQRQIIHAMSDLGRPKAESAARRIESINPDVHVIKHQVRLSSHNTLDIIKDYEFVVDATDNFPTRYLINDACVLSGKGLAHGAVYRFDGQVTTIRPGGRPCYRCLYPEPPPPGLLPSCQEAGVLGAVAGVIGAMQAGEAVKAILGVGDPLVGRLVVYDALRASFREVKIQRDRDCVLCGEHPTVTELMGRESCCHPRTEE
jgi:molybdopterin/thiamine biosynthesis adenylyltransferase